jgi:cell division protein FtsW (lipid II flippase)
VTIPQKTIQTRLLLLSGIIITLFSLSLTLAPAVRYQNSEVELNWVHWIGCFTWIFFTALINRLSFRYLPDHDPFIIPVLSLLTGVGLMTVYRLFPQFGFRQTLWFAISCIILVLIFSHVEILSFLRKYKYLWLTSGLFITTLTIFLGVNPSGADNSPLWLGCCGIYFQPSEILKLLLIVYLSAFLADRMVVPSKGREKNIFINPPFLPLLAPTIIMFGLALLLVVIQRDLGTAAIFLFLYAVIVYIATNQNKVIIISILSLILASFLGYFLFDVVKIRFTAWFNPWLDPTGGSYQIIQALMAIANGEIIGRGLGLGNPGLVPVPHSDFIFSSITEESGLVYAISILLANALLLGRGFIIALKAPGVFRRLLAAGITVYLVGQSLLIIGGNIRLFPLTGVTLPFISYGGSSLIVSFISFGLLLVISNSVDTSPAPLNNAKPYLYVSSFLLFLLLLAGLFSTWWILFRHDNLLNRTDNARRSIAERYSKRGNLFDRSGKPLTTVTGQKGSYERKLIYPESSNVIGYTNPTFGQSGLEASLDPFLRGLEGNSTRSLFWHQLLFGYPPPGLDIRLSLSADLVELSNSILKGQRGSVILLDGKTGELISLASQPSFNANLLSETWEKEIQNTASPFINRATQGNYPPGTILTPLFFAEYIDDSYPLPEFFEAETKIKNHQYACAENPVDLSIGALLHSGCPGFSSLVSKNLGIEAINELSNELGLFDQPVLPLPVNNPQTVYKFLVPELAGIGKGALVDKTTTVSTISISPMQLAVSSSALINEGKLIPPRITLAVKTPSHGWVLFPQKETQKEIFKPETTQKILNYLKIPGTHYWGIVSVAENEQRQYFSWFLGGTIPELTKSSLLVVVVLEENEPAKARSIGLQLLDIASTFP